jgi:CRP-like cAMP-binding protein
MPSKRSLLPVTSPRLHVRYVAGEMICQIGSYVAGIQVIQEGVVASRTFLAPGNYSPCEILGPGDILGLEMLVAESGRISTSQCRAITPTSLDFYQADHVEQVMRERADICTALLQYVTRRCLSDPHGHHRELPIETRLVDLLLRLAGHCGDGTSCRQLVLPEPITVRTLSDLLCVAPRRIRQGLKIVSTFRIEGGRLVFDLEELQGLRVQDLP